MSNRYPPSPVGATSVALAGPSDRNGPTGCAGVGCALMERVSWAGRLERRRRPAREDDVPAEAQGPLRFGGVEVEGGDKAGPRRLRHAAQDRVVREERIV